MDAQGLILFLAIGAVVGWLADEFMKGTRFGLLGDMVLGILGAVVGGIAFGSIGMLGGGLLGSVVAATVTAALLLYIVGQVKQS
ncbi:MAG: GlsB/YeaQ/YmgE family stress response membrane protein [Candidatus Promineifilaceae bacterium]|jgi:uncharacterized membrane protein YeaQ/YmgE (transglycosylase-associated protein family)